jgi:hypothetical protein
LDDYDVYDNHDYREKGASSQANMYLPITFILAGYQAIILPTSF